MRGRVNRRKRNADGNPTKQSHDSPALDTRSHTVEFDDNDQTANLFADSMYAQCDPDGNQHLLLADIVDHRGMDNATKFNDQTVVCDGRTYLSLSTAGWQLCCQWIDGSTPWEKP